jgi:hypothetical protein
MVKELRSRMRGRRAFVVLTIYLLAMSGLISLVYAVYASAAATPYGPDPSRSGQGGFCSGDGRPGLFWSSLSAPLLRPGPLPAKRSGKRMNCCKRRCSPRAGLSWAN